jgi:hypothetical protein
VTSKGIINGLSVLPNDGKGGFGPDTTLDATAPGQYGGSYTKTDGLKEAINYAINNGISTITIIGYNNNNTINYTSNDTFDLSSSSLNNFMLEIRGEGDSIGVSIAFQGSGGITFNNTTSTTNGLVILFKGIVFNGGSTTNGLTINGNSDAVVNMTVIFRGVVIGGLSGKTLVNISNVLFISDQIILSDSSAPSMIIDSCRSTIQAIRNSGYIKFTNSSGSSTNYVNIDSYEFLTNNQTTPFFEDMPSIHIGVLIAQMAAVFSGTNTIVSIDNLIVTGANTSAGTINGYLMGTGTSPTIDYLTIGNTQATYSTTVLSVSPAIYASSLTINNLRIKRSLVFYPAFSTPTMPSSGTAQSNTLQTSVNVYVYGGDVTKIQITKDGTAYTVFSVSTAIAMSGQAYKLNPDDSITVTYSTAPTWEWLSD